MEDGHVLLKDMRLRLGVPVDEWVSALGPLENVRERDQWRRYSPQYRVFVHSEETVCDDEWVTSVEVLFERNEWLSGSTVFGDRLSVGTCIFQSGDLLPFWGLDCGVCVMRDQGRFGAFGKSCTDDGIRLAATTSNQKLEWVTYSMSRESPQGIANYEAMGVVNSWEAEGFRQAGGCDDRRDRVVIGDDWREIHGHRDALGEHGENRGSWWEFVSGFVD